MRAPRRARPRREPSRSLSVLLFAALGCGPSELTLLVPDLPPTVRHLAVVARSADRRVDATALLPVGEGGGHRVSLASPVSDGATVHLFGFEAATLEGVLPADLSLVEGTPLGVATDRGPALPRPDFHAEARVLDSTIPLAPSAPPGFGVTASWLPACSPLPAPPVVDLACALRACTVAFAQDGCAVSLDPSSCILAPVRLSGRIDAAGSFELRSEGVGLSSCVPTQTRAGPLFELACRRSDDEPCSVRGYDPASPEFGFDLDRIELESVSGYPIDHQIDQEEGAIRGLVVRDDRVYVHHRQGSPRYCVAGEHRDRVSVLDAQSTSLLLGFDVSICVTGLAADPAGEGVLVFGLGPEGPELQRFSAAGELVLVRVLASAHESGGGRFPLRSANLVSDPGTRWLGALVPRVRPDDSFYHQGALVLRLDPVSLVPTGTVTRLSGHFEQLLRLSDGRAAVVEEEEDELHLIGWPSMAVERTLGLRTLNAIEPRRVSHLYEHAAAGRLLLSHVKESNAGLVPIRTDGGAVESLRLVYEAAGHPFGLGPWPPDPRFALASYLVTQDDHRAYLTLYELEPGRYRFGARAIGRGPARFVTADRHGRVWAALPWAGEVVRVNPTFGPR